MPTAAERNREIERLRREAQLRAIPRPINPAEAAGIRGGAAIRKPFAEGQRQLRATEEARAPAFDRAGRAITSSVAGFFRGLTGEDPPRDPAEFSGIPSQTVRGERLPAIRPPDIGPPPVPVLAEPGADHTNGTPGSDGNVAEQTVDLPEEDASIIGEDGVPVVASTDPLPLSEIGPSGTRVLPTPPRGGFPTIDERIDDAFNEPLDRGAPIGRSRAAQNVLPEGQIEILRGAEQRFQDLNVLGSPDFPALPGQGFNASRRAAIASDPSLQFLSQQDTSRLSAEASAETARANFVRAQSLGTEIGTTGTGDNERLVLLRPDENGVLQEQIDFTPKVDALINGPTEYQTAFLENPETLQEELIFFDPRDPINNRFNLSAHETMEAAVAMYNRLIQEGEDKEDALQEAEDRFRVILTPTQ